MTPLEELNRALEAAEPNGVGYRHVHGYLDGVPHYHAQQREHDGLVELHAGSMHADPADLPEGVEWRAGGG